MSAAVIELINKEQAGITVLDNQFPSSQKKFIGDFLVGYTMHDTFLHIVL